MESEVFLKYLCFMFSYLNFWIIWLETVLIFENGKFSVTILLIFRSTFDLKGLFLKVLCVVCFLSIDLIYISWNWVILLSFVGLIFYPSSKFVCKVVSTIRLLLYVYFSISCYECPFTFFFLVYVCFFLVLYGDVYVILSILNFLLVCFTINPIYSWFSESVTTYFYILPC